MIEKLDILISKLANQPTIRALRRGLLYLLPLILMGSIVLALISLPIPAYQNFMINVFGEGWQSIGVTIHKSTLKVVAILSLITVSYAISNEMDIVKSGEISSIVTVITSLVSFLVFINNTEVIFSDKIVGSSGMFEAIIIAIIACKLFKFFYKYCNRILYSRIAQLSGSIHIRESFSTVIPVMLTILIFSVIKVCFRITGLYDGQTIINEIINEVWMRGSDSISVLLTLLNTHILWFFGIHGGNIVMDSMPGLGTIVDPTTKNAIFTKEFFDTYVYLGGAGTTLGLLIAMLFSKKKSSERKLAKISILPAIFNINEIIIYGLPIIFNPYYIIPFLLSPIVLSFTAWVPVSLGLVPPITQKVEWTTPIFISGYISTGSVMGIVIQAFNLLLAILIYTPFVRLQERDQQRVRIRAYNKLVHEILYLQERLRKPILNRHDETGSIARALMNEIKYGLMNNCVPMHLEYQPKVNYKGEIMGAEALLRWNHPIYGYVSPLVILRICEEANLANGLGRWIIKRAFSEQEYWNIQKYSKVSLSINISPRQLQEDDTLVQYVKSCIELYHIDPRYTELEITENATIDLSDSTQNKLKQIRAYGINLSIDDFGMGHSSLRYICDLYANIVKIDASLVRNITKDGHYKQIINSIINLCAQLKVNVVAEGVETKEQVEMLNELGCKYFQGFYFSKSLTSKEFLNILNKNGCIQEDTI